MKKQLLFTISLLVSMVSASPVHADFDTYPGDSSIYGVESATKPNVLIIIDNSGSMSETVPAGSYDSSTTYDDQNVCNNQPYSSSNSCTANYVYQRTTSHGNPVYTLLYSTTTSTTQVWHDGYWTGSGWRRRWVPGYWEDVNTYTYSPLLLSQVPATCGTLNPQSTMESDGIYTGYKLNPASSGTATCDTSRNGYTYVTGNYVNYSRTDGAPVAKEDVAISVVKNLIKTTDGVNFGLMTYYYKTVSYSTTGEGGTFLSQSNPFGTSTGTYVTTIKNMDTAFPSVGFGNAACITPSQCTNRDALIKAVDLLSANGNTPLAETLYEAGRYFAGAAPAFGATIGVTSGTYTSPIVSPCQRNFVIFVTDGMATADDNASVLGSIGTSGDTDSDSEEPDSTPPSGYSRYWHSIDDVAKYLNISTQNITTYFIGFGDVGSDPQAVTLLNRAGDDSHGKGGVYLATSQNSLASTLTTIMSEIYSVNSSFVAPVVPVSPQNRTYGSNRVFMGFFKPNANSYWSGNLKKYSLGQNNYLLDVDGNNATWVDEDNNGIDDRTNEQLDSDASNGSFRSTSRSFWTPDGIVDAGTVRRGGAGEVMKTQIGSRHIYTYNGTNLNLADSSNAISAVGYATLGLANDAAKTSLMNFLQGYDAYNEDGDASTTTREWVMGDILHSRPLIINYKQYEFTETNEKDGTKNGTMIFVGGNDGMLHAINDYNGSEAWAFVPPDTLGKLKDIIGVYHPIFTDSSVSAYVYDRNNDGNIDYADGDKAILLFGERRGGGTHTSTPSGTDGYYYALDVSNPAAPAYLWSISSATSGFGALGESWSEPKIAKIKMGGVSKIVAFFGAGYDNPNEDGRYGATQAFPSSTSPTDTDSGSGYTTNGSTTATNPKGRGIYAIELATLNSGSVTIRTSPTQIWRCTYGATDTNGTGYRTKTDMTYSFPSELTAIDTKNNGFTDRLYAVDTGANLWRFDVDDTTTTANWTAKRIFSSNITTDNGRKVFYKPTVASESGYKMVYFGTGDREHPLNTRLYDRIYAFKDPDVEDFSAPKTEDDLFDMTLDPLQNTTLTGTALSTMLSTTFSSLNSSYGWFIKLNETSADGHDPGEKVLAEPTVFSKVLYVTTYAPSATTSATACTGNLGTARLYALDYKTGEAVYNYYGNGTDITLANTRARDASGNILNRSDRSVALGSGIPSGVVVLISPGGQASIMAGVGGKIATIKTKTMKSIFPYYWRKK